VLGTRRWRALVAAEATGITLAFTVAPARAADEGAEAQADELIRRALDMRRSGDDRLPDAHQAPGPAERPVPPHRPARRSPARGHDDGSRRGGPSNSGRPLDAGVTGRAARSGQRQRGFRGSGPLRRSLKFLAWGTAIGATAFAIYGFNDKRERIEEFNAGCGVDPTGAAVSKPDAPPGYSDQHCASLRNRFQWSSTAAWVGVASSVALTVGGFVLWLTESEPSLRQTAAADCLRTLVAGPSTLGCTVRF